MLPQQQRLALTLNSSSSALLGVCSMSFWPTSREINRAKRWLWNHSAQVAGVAACAALIAAGTAAAVVVSASSSDAGETAISGSPMAGKRGSSVDGADDEPSRGLEQVATRDSSSAPATESGSGSESDPSVAAAPSTTRPNVRGKATIMTTDASGPRMHPFFLKALSSASFLPGLMPKSPALDDSSCKITLLLSQFPLVRSLEHNRGREKSVRTRGLKRVNARQSLPTLVPATATSCFQPKWEWMTESQLIDASGQQPQRLRLWRTCIASLRRLREELRRTHLVTRIHLMTLHRKASRSAACLTTRGFWKLSDSALQSWGAAPA